MGFSCSAVFGPAHAGPICIWKRISALQIIEKRVYTQSAARGRFFENALANTAIGGKNACASTLHCRRTAISCRRAAAICHEHKSSGPGSSDHSPGEKRTKRAICIYARISQSLQKGTVRCDSFVTYNTQGIMRNANNATI